MTNTPINNVVVVSDLHVGCQLGLCPPDGVILDNGGRYLPSAIQLKVWALWEEFWGKWVPEFTHGEPYAVVINGDAIDGSHLGSTHQWSHNLKDQRRAAEQILRPVVDAAEGRYYHIRGTPAHVGESGCEEEELAHDLGAIPNGEGNYARNELWARIGRGLAHFTHHIGTAGRTSYETSALMAELSEAYVIAGRWNEEPPDWVVRAHRHICTKIDVPTHKGFATSITSPAWQLKTPFTFKVAGARQATPQIGGLVLRCGDIDLFTRMKVWALERPKVEVI